MKISLLTTKLKASKAKYVFRTGFPYILYTEWATAFAFIFFVFYMISFTNSNIC